MNNQAMEWLAGTRGARLAQLAALLLGIWATYLLAQIVWLVIPVPVVEEAPVTATAPRPSSTASAVDTRRIAQWHLFGQADQAVTQRAAPIDAPETRLNLVLSGVFTSDEPERARAIIAAQNQDGKTYKIGDEIPGGAELSEIYADRVILLRAGRHETLKLPKQPLSGNQAAQVANTTVAANPEATAILRQYREVLTTNPRALIDLVRPIGHQEAGRFVGFRLYPGNRSELFGKFGLRPGDLVTEINGITLDSAARGVQVLQQLRDAQNLNLHIRRGREELDVSFSLS